MRGRVRVGGLERVAELLQGRAPLTAAILMVFKTRIERDEPCHPMVDRRSAGEREQKVTHTIS
jgi:hypothetical protein